MQIMTAIWTDIFTRRNSCVACLAAMLFLLTMATTAAAATVAGGQIIPDGDEILLRGPVHEGFAQFITFDPQPGLVVVTQPPAPLVEIPPEVKPAARQFVWLPGYWAWDAGRNDFLWVSGVWRLPPPGRTWVPGHWTRTAGGWQRLAGYWEPMESVATRYLPAPPPSREVGPAAPAPMGDAFWAPGYWQWLDRRYVWTVGRWVPQVPGRVWIAPHYTRAPGGDVFSSGYWDYPLTSRGLLFAPVYFKDRSLLAVALPYSPEVVLDTNVLQNFLFVEPRYRQFWFGDYFETAYTQLGIYPWIGSMMAHFGPTPLFTYASWSNGQRQPDWNARIVHWYADLIENPGHRPPRTFVALQVLHQRKEDRAAGVAGLATPIADLLSDRNFAPPLVAMDDATRALVQPLTAQVRLQMETRVARQLAARNALAAAETPLPVVLESPIIAMPSSGARAIVTARVPYSAAPRGGASGASIPPSLPPVPSTPPATEPGILR
jgi:hypothetical protein